MLKKTIFLGAITLFASQIAMGQGIQHFSITPQKAVAGEKIQIAYNPKATVLEGKKKVSATVFQFRNYAWSKQEYVVYYIYLCFTIIYVWQVCN
ncbi:hypothetical protein ACJVDH_08445 [Pedobacter sp. AW1-32]|uniref:hypothetical protein n=1 Tax=Pedobacter sp. AW1-32 TaxID=3383026 RepID=UPI003FF13188